MKDTPRRLCVGVFGFPEMAYLYGHDLFFLVVEYRIQRFGELVEQLLRLGFTVFRLVFGHAFLLGLLEGFDSVPACVAQADAGGFRLLAYLLDQLFAPLFRQGRNRQSDLLPVVRGGQPDVGVDDRLFDRADQVFVPGLDQNVLASGTVTLATPEIGV